MAFDHWLMQHTVLNALIVVRVGSAPTNGSLQTTPPLDKWY
jgi:hypothetical protein